MTLLRTSFWIFIPSLWFFGIIRVLQFNFLQLEWPMNKQNRSTEGCLKFKVQKHDKVRRNWSQHYNKCKSQMEQDQVSGGVSVLFWLTAPVAMFYGNLLRFCNKVIINDQEKQHFLVSHWLNRAVKSTNSFNVERSKYDSGAISVLNLLLMYARTTRYKNECFIIVSWKTSWSKFIISNDCFVEFHFNKSFPLDVNVVCIELHIC